MDEKILEILKNIDGISVADGLEYCGSSASYIKFLGTFHAGIEKKASEIETALSEEDYVLFTTKVHAIKSMARIAGFKELSDLALKLEDAGDAGDISFIRENVQEFLTKFRGYINKLSVLEEHSGDWNDSGKEITETELKDAYRSLKECIFMEDYDAVEVILAEIKKYSVPHSDKIVINKLDILHRNLDWGEMKEIISSVNP